MPARARSRIATQGASHPPQNSPKPLPAFRLEAASAFMRALRPSVSEEARQQRLNSMLKPAPEGGFTWRYDHAGIARARLQPDQARTVDLGAYVGRIACPTLLVRGGRSDYLQPAMVKRTLDLNPLIQAISCRRRQLRS